MKLPLEAELLRIFISEGHRYKGRPLFEVIVERARQNGMAGATVLRGLLGFGADRHMHTAKILRLSADLPVVVEIVDESEKIACFLRDLEDVIHEGLVTREKVQMTIYRNAPDGVDASL